MYTNKQSCCSPSCEAYPSAYSKFEIGYIVETKMAIAYHIAISGTRHKTKLNPTPNSILIWFAKGIRKHTSRACHSCIRIQQKVTRYPLMPRYTTVQNCSLESFNIPELIKWIVVVNFPLYCPLPLLRRTALYSVYMGPERKRSKWYYIWISSYHLYTIAER